MTGVSNASRQIGHSRSGTAAHSTAHHVSAWIYTVQHPVGCNMVSHEAVRYDVSSCRHQLQFRVHTHIMVMTTKPTAYVRWRCAHLRCCSPPAPAGACCHPQQRPQQHPHRQQLLLLLRVCLLPHLPLPGGPQAGAGQRASNGRHCRSCKHETSNKARRQSMGSNVDSIRHFRCLRANRCGQPPLRPALGPENNCARPHPTW